jgi:hypothetical protein
MSNTNAMKRPQIVWSSYTASFDYPVDNWSSHSQPREGSAFTQMLSGLENAWVTGRDYTLSFDLRWIPGTSSGTPTCWDGTGGIREMLEYMQEKNTFDWYPDSGSNSHVTSYLVEPMGAPGIQVEPDGTRSMKLTIRNATTPYNGY